jgi:acetyl-CoA synthetase
MLNEPRVFPPCKHFSDKAAIKSLADYEQIYRYSIEQPEQFWAEIANTLHWFKPWKTVLKWQEPAATWFEEAKTNITYNCLDRHLAHYGDKPALIWEGEPGDQRQLSYKELYEVVCQFANGLKKLGVKKADCVTLYMPLVPELIIAVLACARLGIIHNVVFAGYSAQALASRILDSKSKWLITANAGYRRGTIIPLKSIVDAALEICFDVEKVIVYQRTQECTALKPGRDITWQELIYGLDSTCAAEPLDSEAILFLLYTSGSTGIPKGILHTTAGYMVGAYYTAKIVFDLKPEDIYWCTADVGWITGHTYVVYGPLLNAASIVIYEGAPNWPEPNRFWKIIDKYKVNIFYTAPTAVRSFMKWGDQWINEHDLSSLRLLGSVGEPLNPDAWIWYYKNIGKDRCPIVDTWWQTETGTIMISPIPGVTLAKPGSVAKPLPGVVVDIVDPISGKPVASGQGGSLVIRQPWPSMLRGIWNDPKRYAEQYWQPMPHAYFSGDTAHYDDNGYIWIRGRLDDVIKVSGHRLSTAEIESALLSHPQVAEAAVVAMPDAIRGQAITAFVTLRDSSIASSALKKEIINQVQQVIGSLAKPKRLIFAMALPKTRSGKIMRRLLRDIAANRRIEQDTSTLEDFSVLIELQKNNNQST